MNVASNDDANVQVYAVLREDWTLGAGHTVCANRQSHAMNARSARLVYTSTSNVVEARLVIQASRLSTQFLIKVERNAPSYVSVLQQLLNRQAGWHYWAAWRCARPHFFTVVRDYNGKIIHYATPTQ